MSGAPTIGRLVWYYPGRNEGLGINPLAAFIAAVHSESRIAIGGFTATGAAFAKQNVAFVQVDEDPVLDHTGINGYARWPVREQITAPKPQQQQQKQGGKA